MKAEMNYERMVQLLQGHAPRLENERELTDAIMQRCGRRDDRRVLKWVRALSGIAALWLCCMFVWQEDVLHAGRVPGSDGAYARLSVGVDRVPMFASPEGYRAHLQQNVESNRRLKERITNTKTE